MKIVKYVGAVLATLLCFSQASANDWSTADTVRQAAVLATFAVDYKQTSDIKNHPGMYETNPLLGPHPSQRTIRAYFITAALVHTGVMALLPPDTRAAVQYGTIVLQVAVIGHNKYIGLKTSW